MREAIQAGAAFVELFVRDAKLREGIDQAITQTKAKLSGMSASTGAAAAASASRAVMPSATVATAAPRAVMGQAVGAAGALRAMGSGVNRVSWALAHSAKVLGAVSIAGRVAFGGMAAGLRATGALASLSLRGLGGLTRGLAGLGGAATGPLVRGLGVGLGAIGRGIRPLGGMLAAPLSSAAGGFAKLGGIAARNYVTSWKLWFGGRLLSKAGAAGGAAGAAGPLAGLAGGAGAAGPAGGGGMAAAVRPMAAAQGAASAVRAVGMRFMGAGAAMAAFAVPIALLTSRFTSLGKEVYDASKKTGVSTETLSALRYVGQQTGVSFDAMAAAAGAMGAKSPTALADVADKLNAIQDPAARAAEATRLLGDQAPALAPALAIGGAALRKLAADAQASGAIVSKETATLANAVSGGAKRIAGEAKAGLDQLALSIGGALIGDLGTAKSRIDAVAGGIRGTVRNVTQWIAANKGLVTNVVQGIALVGLLGGAFVTAGSALTLLSMSATAVAGFLGALLSPAVLVTGAIVAGAYAWTQWTASGKAAVSGLMDAFGPLVKTVKAAIGGITDALTAGDIGLAGRIAFGGLKLAALEALGGVAQIVDSVFSTGIGQSIKDLTADLVSGNFSQIGEDLLNLWGNVVDGIVGLMARAVNGVINLWRGMVSGIANSLVKMAAQDGVMGRIARTIVGRDLRGKMGPETAEQQATRRRNLEEAQTIRKQKLAEATAAGDQEEVSKWTMAVAQGEQELAAIGQAGASMMNEASASIAAQTAQWGSGAQKYLDGLRATTEQRAAQRNQDRAAERKERGLPDFEAMLQRERDAQAALLGEAADKAAKARAAAAAADEAGPGEDGKKKGAGMSSGSGATFSAAAAQFLGGASAQERTARNTEKSLKVLERVASLDEQILAEHKIGGVFGGAT